jgi:RNA polymerase sigma-70 factor (ECF subfamily)
MQHGDREPLNDIYRDYIGFIYSVAFSVVGSRENAEDISADFFIRLWEQAEKYRPGTGHKAWMSRIAHNMAIDFLRKRKRETLTDEMSAAGDDESTSGKNIYDNAFSNPVEDEVVVNLSLQQALKALSEEERSVINMKIIGDMTFKSISEALGLSMGTVTWRYQSAIKKLRKYGYE